MLNRLSKPTSAYLNLLGKEQSLQILALFADIEAGKYAKDELHEFRLAGFPHPVCLRAIRADMQSFINTFIEPYLGEKDYLHGDGLVIDAGANIGYTALLFAQWWPQASIISIEPDRENYELALRNTRDYPNIRVICAALWHKAQALSIAAGQEDGFVVRESVGEDHPANITHGITVQELLSLSGQKRIAFLKLNVEGSEKEIFSEAYDSWLPLTHALLVELHDGKRAGCSQALFSALAPYRFAVAETAPYGILFVDEAAYRSWYTAWYRDTIYVPNIDHVRFPRLYLDADSE